MMTTPMINAKSTLQSGQFKPKSSSATKDLTSLEQELQALLKNVPKDEYIPASERIEFKYQEPPTQTPQTNTKPISPGVFQPLTEEAAKAVPEVQATAVTTDIGRVIADQLQTIIRQREADTSKTNYEQAEKQFQLQKKHEVQQRLADEIREIDKNHQTARQKIMLLGLNTVGLATFGIVAAPAFAVAAPAGAAGAAVLAMTQITVATSLLSYVSSMFNTMTELIGNKQSVKAAKSLVGDFLGLFGKASSFGKRIFGFHKSGSGLKFSGKTDLQTKQSQSVDTVETLQEQLVEASERFYQDIDKASTEFEKNQVAQNFQIALLTATQSFMLEHGTEAEKKKIRQIQKFHTNFETLANAFTGSMQKYSDLPLPAQNHLRQMIFDTLTSDVPELKEWGRKQGRAIGMSLSRINELFYKVQS